MSIPHLLNRWRSDPNIAAAIQVWHEIQPQTARIVPFPVDIHPALREGLQKNGIEALFTHQASSLNAARAKKNFVVVTGTASGKTLCYNLPVLDHLLKDEQARALYLFPTKALSQDQAASLRKLLEDLEEDQTPKELLPSLAIYDGDTPTNVRQLIRSKTRILFSNPDMLHLGILPHHTRWVDYFSRLRFIVIDEAHVYRGVFGSHVANVIRRLRRVCSFYGSQPQFILTSATIANPEELVYRLTEVDVELISDDGAAHGPKTFLIYNPPITDPELGLRRSAVQESVRLAKDILTDHIQTIIFGRSRRTVELILSYLREQSPKSYSFYPDHQTDQDFVGSKGNFKHIRGYRSGYLPQIRREIERGLRQGDIQAVVATNALELGIDIGGMGAALLVGYPGTIAASWQQSGRAGRGSEPALAILIATADPLDQFLAAHPEYFFDRSPEQALINPDNLLILLDHLRCAAFELPFQTGESFGRVDPNDLLEYLSFLQEQGTLHRSGEKFFWMADQYPAQSISLRSTDANPIILQVQEENKQTTIGQIDRASAHWLIHPNAIYLHEAETYFVEDLDLERNLARLRPIDTDYYTLPQRETTVQLIEVHQSVEVRGANKKRGEIQVTSKVTGFKKIRWISHELIGVEPLEMPPVDLLTTGYWITLPAPTINELKENGFWNIGPIDYGPNWDSQRNRARRRDGFRCQVCGILEGERSHHVHHRVPFRMFTSFAQANVLENLVTLCPDCHRRVETAVRVRSGLAGLAFVLGNLAPFFLMCDVSDLGVHSDAQSPLAEGSPAIVIYDQAPAGLGFSERLFEIHNELIQRAFELVAACQCSDGCPSCVGPGGESGAGGKQETLAILRSL